MQGLHSPARRPAKNIPSRLAATVLFSLGVQVLCALPAHAQNAPEITPSLKKLLHGLPIGESRDELKAMVSTLKKTSCDGGLTGCYATQSGPMQLYFFTSKQSQQTLLLVVDKKMAMPTLLKDNLQKLMGGTAISAPMISLSTTDFELDMAKMPPPLQKIVRERYFNVNALSFASGVQIAARTELGGAVRALMQGMGVDASQMAMRAAVVMPIPLDLTAGASTGAGAADAVAHGETMKKAGLDALSPEAFVEFQFAPGSTVQVGLPKINLTDATFFINNALTFGYKGNAYFEGVPNKKTLMHFQTPLTPAGVMDLADFQFLMATPPNLTMADAANIMIAMATPDGRLAKYGGGFIRDIGVLKQPLRIATKPLSVFKLKNPLPQPDYKFGDSTKPFPTDTKYFNFIIAGPSVEGGPLLKSVGEVTFMGQRMGSLNALADVHGFNGKAVQDLSLKIGPLGKLTLEKMVAEAKVDAKNLVISLKGNALGQVVQVSLDENKLHLDVPANCVNPFEIKASLTFDADTDIAKVFDAQGGVNVDPTTIGGCIGKELEAALNKIANEYKNLSGYTAAAANAELKKISNAANAAAAEAQKQADAAAKEAQKQADAAAAEARKQAEAARKEYERTKDAARDVASKTSNAANKAFNDAGNAFKRLGKKKKHKKKGPDPLFAAPVFDWDYYYDNAPDVVKAKVDLATHWKDHGFDEGRQGSPEFSAVFYRDRYIDVQAQCGQDKRCALQHWLDHGVETGRQGSAEFSVWSYLNRYPDLQAAFGVENYADAMAHWNSDGEDEGRKGKPTGPVATGPIAGAVRIGGDGGSAWSDKTACADQYVNGFRLRNGKTVDMVQFSYAGKGWSGTHGTLNGKLTADVTLPAGEYITRVDYRHGSRVDNLTFRTNRGRTFGPYGGGGGSPGTYTVTPGEKLGCMSGRSGSSVDQLTFTSTGPR